MPRGAKSRRAEYELVGVVSYVRDRAHKGGQEEGHLVLHVKAPKQGHGTGGGKGD